MRDKLLVGAVRAAYADYLPRDRHPLVALFVTLDAREVDVNVHPAKTEVRFRNAGLVRALIVHALKAALAREGTRAATTGGSATIAAFRPERRKAGDRRVRWRRSPCGPAIRAGRPHLRGRLCRSGASRVRGRRAGGRVEFCGIGVSAGPAPSFAAPAADALDHPLGAARAQVHDTYIVAQTRDGLVIVDQHAAHERIVYEKLKAAIDQDRRRAPNPAHPRYRRTRRGGCRADCSRTPQELARYGLVLESFGPGAVALRETPALLGEIDGVGLVRDLAEHISEWDEALPLERRLMHVAATMACYGSVRVNRFCRLLCNRSVIQAFSA